MFWSGLTSGGTRRASAVLVAGLLALATAPAAVAATAVPTLIHDVKTGYDTLGTADPSAPEADYVQPDTQIEPSVAVNPANPLNVVIDYQEGRIDSGGDATNGYATTFDGGVTWQYGELPKLTTFGTQGGSFERASDAVVAFGPDNVVYANSLVFTPSGGNLRSGMAVNVSKDGGATWSDPVILQDDLLAGTNDKNWIVVDNSDAPGHHKGRVYVVWDRVAPVVYDYCDADCDQLSNWLPTLQKLDPVVFPGQGIGSYPIVERGGGLGIVIQTLSGGAPTGIDEAEPAAGNQVYIRAPLAGQTPYPAPLAFDPPIQIGQNLSSGTRAQRASGGLPAAAVDHDSGAVYAVWDDGRFRSDAVNDAVISKSTDDGTTWSAIKRVNPGPTNDSVDHYNVTVSVGSGGTVHVTYRQRDESASSPLFTPFIDTYYQESYDGGNTWTDPLKVNSVPSNAYYGAFSRGGTFEGDYNESDSAGGNTYIVRAQGQPTDALEPPALTPGAAADSLALEDAGRGHQHQSAWVALVRDEAPGAGAGVGATVPGTAPKPKAKPAKRCKSRRRLTIRLHEPKGAEHLVSAVVKIDGKKAKVFRRAGRLRVHLNFKGRKKSRVTVRIRAKSNLGRTLKDTRRYKTCATKAKKKKSKKKSGK